METAPPYRSPPQAADASKAPRELVYAVRHPASLGLGPTVLMLVVGGGVFAGLTALGQTTAGITSFLGITALQMWHRARRASGVVLRIEGSMLLVYPWRGARRASAVPLDDLHDVRLDTKTIHKEQRDTRAGVYAFAGAAGSIPVDVSRIQLVLSEAVEPIELTSEFGAYSETVEQIARMKTFLRACGWLPRDEREPAAPE